MNAAIANDQDELRDLYRQLILDHARSPRHFGKLAAATHRATGINPLCGDRLDLYLQLDESRNIVAAAFEGSGCAISVASASLLTDGIIGLSASAAQENVRAVIAHLTAATDITGQPLDLGKIRALDGVRKYPSRVKCATLAWHALDSALENRPGQVSTE